MLVNILASLIIVMCIGALVVLAYLIKYLVEWPLVKKDNARPHFIDPEKCMHTDWEPESRENGWRSYCLDCNLTAAGSCQG